MTPRSNSFQKALADAEKRLAKALNERAMAQETLNDLALEIPSLQNTIEALQHQLNKTKSETAVRAIPSGQEAGAFIGVAPLGKPASESYIVDEDSLLPEVDGTPLIED
jgi:hypothetical protein